MNKDQHNVKIPSFLILTLGCKLNQLESEAVIDAFLKAGFIYLPENSDPSLREQGIPPVVIVNTCTVTSKADQKARCVIRKALREYPDSRVIVTGCYAQLNKDDILKLETGNKKRLFVVNKKNILELPEYLDQLTNNSLPLSNLNSQFSTFSFNPQRFSNHTRSFLKIQDGCDKHCTYCKICLVRGKSVSLDADEVLSRLRILEQTHAEAVLTGVNISQYQFSKEKEQGEENKGSSQLAELLDFLLRGTEKIAVRLSSLAPESVDEKLAKVLSHPRIRPHFHLSIQSCSEKILARMGRDYTAETLQRAVSLLHSAKDDPFLACDIITGFPGETDIEFEETYSFCKKNDFAWIHVFPYSKRKGTPAFSFTDTVKESFVKKRVQLFSELAKSGKASYVRRWLGCEVEVLVENREQRKENKEQKNENFVFGTSQNYLKILVRCQESRMQTQFAPSPGETLRCTLLEEGDYDNYDALAH